MLCYVTPKEHLACPENREMLKAGCVAYKIAAPQPPTIAKGHPPAPREWGTTRCSKATVLSHFRPGRISFTSRSSRSTARRYHDDTNDPADGAKIAHFLRGTGEPPGRKFLFDGADASRSGDYGQQGHGRTRIGFGGFRGKKKETVRKRSDGPRPSAIFVAGRRAAGGGGVHRASTAHLRFGPARFRPPTATSY